MARKSQIASGSHERLTAKDDTRSSSDRAFGVTLCCVFLALSLVPLLHARPVNGWTLGVASAFGAAAWVRPALLAPLNAAWFRFGLVLHKITNPVILGALYFGVLTPLALLLRLMRHKLLAREFDPGAASYWIHRTPPGPEPESVRNQF